MIDLLAEPSSTNLAWKLVQAVLPTDTASPWGQALQVFTSVLFALCSLTVAFNVVQGVVASAYTGKVLGERFHSIYMPLRVVLGLGLLAPIPATGFSSAHYILRDVVARAGINLADATWSVFVGAVSKDGTTIIPTSSSGSALALSILKHEICTAVYNKAGSTWGWQIDPPPPGGEDGGLGIWGSESVVAWNWAPTCGRLAFSVPADRQAFSDARRNAVADLVNALRPEAQRYAKIAAQTSGINSADGIRQAVGSSVLSPKLVHDLRALGARYDAKIAAAARASASQVEVEARNRLAENAKDQGFLTAGMYFMSLSQISQLTTSLTNEIPSDEPARIDGDFGQAIERGFKILNLQVTGELQREALTADDFAAAGDDQSGVLVKLLAPISRSLVEWGAQATSGAGEGDALGNLVASGHAMLSIGWSAIAAGGAAAAIATNSVADAVGADGAASWFLEWSKWIIGALMLVGSIRAYLIPILPFFFVLMSGIALVSALLEAMIALPLWAMQWSKLDNDHEFAGAAVRGGLMLLVDIFLRPVLAILALCGSYPVFNVVLNTLDKFWPTAFLAQSGGSVVGLGAFIFMSIFQAYLSWFVCLQLFGQSWSLPDRIPRWIGISSSGGESSMTNKAVSGILALASRTSMPKIPLSVRSRT